MTGLVWSILPRLPGWRLMGWQITLSSKFIKFHASVNVTKARRIFLLNLAQLLFLNKFWEDTSPFCGADACYPCFGRDVTSALGFKARADVSCAFSPVRSGFLRFTSGVTPASLLMASMEASHVSYMHLAEVGCWVQAGDLPHSKQTRSPLSPIILAMPNN